MNTDIQAKASTFGHTAVIGGAGFIGRCLVARLAERGLVSVVDLVAPSDPDIVHKIADVRDLPGLLAAIGDGVDTIVNLAAVHRDDVRPVSLYDEVNVDGARVACEAARKLGVRTIVFTSSVAVYGFSDRETGEDSAIAPFNDYGRTKAEAERVYREWQAEDPDRRRLVILRPTVVFGEGNRGNVYALMREIARRRFVMVGDGQNRKSIAYVDNLVAFILWCSGLGAGVHVYNYIDKPDLDMNTLVKTLEMHLRCKQRLPRLPYGLALTLGRCADIVAIASGRTFPISAIRVRKFVSSSVYANGGERIGFTPPYSIEEALARTIRHEFPLSR